MADTLRITADITAHYVQAGGAAQANITVENLSTVVDTYTLRIDGPKASWAELGSESVSMFPGSPASTPIRISPPRDSGSPANAYEFIITATSGNNALESDSVSISVTVEPFYEYDVDLRPRRFEGAKGPYTLILTNKGNSDLTFSLDGRDAEEICNFTFEPAIPVVAPGETREVAVTVSSTRPLRGVSVSRFFELTISPPPGIAEPTSTQGELVVAPRIPGWVPLAATIGVVAIVVGVGLFFWIQNLRALPDAAVIDITTPILLTQGESRLVRANVRDIEGIAHEYKVTWEVRNRDDQPSGVIGLISDSGDETLEIMEGLQTVTVKGAKAGLANLVASVSSGEDKTLDRTVEVFVSPPNANQECIQYNPLSLRLRPDGQDVVLTDNNVDVLVMSTTDDPVSVLNLAKSHTTRCFIGRGSVNLAEIRGHDRVEFWLGSSLLNGDDMTLTVSDDCLEYLPDTTEAVNLAVTAAGVEPGEKLTINVERPESLEPVRSLVASNTRVCYLSAERDAEGDVTHFLTQFWN